MAKKKETTKKAPAKKKVTTKKAPKAKDINEALFNFQAEEIVIPRNGTGNINGRAYKYALLDDIMEIIKPLLQKHRILVTQLVGDENLLTKLIHVDTGSELVAPLPLGKPSSAQDLGSRITYLRRYALVAALGLVVDQDVDGQVPTVDTPKEGVAKSQKVSASQVKKVDPTTVSNDSESRSEAYVKALSAVESASSPEAMEMIGEQLDRSSRLTDAEKKELKDVLKKRDEELNGTKNID